MIGVLGKTRRTAVCATLMLVGACGKAEPEARPPTPQSPNGSSAREAPPAEAQSEASFDAEMDSETLEDLAALGYAFFESDPDDEGAGVVLHERARAHPGYTLCTNMPGASAMLIDMDGQTVKSWDDGPRRGSWARAMLLPDGDLLCVTKKSGLLRLSWDGEEVWRTEDLRVHHDVNLNADGTFLTLLTTARIVPELDPDHPTIVNSVARFSADGELLDELSLVDALLKSSERIDLRTVEYPEIVRVRRDPIHANAAEWMQHPHLVGQHPIYALDNVIVTMRHLNIVAVLNWTTRELVWAWGEDHLQGPHEGSVLENGNLLIFDNGWNGRDSSRILEVDPRDERIVWEYTRPGFYSKGRGTAQALPGGNVLVGYSSNGEVFEVTREGEIVWRWLNPHTSSDGARGAIRAERYEMPFVERILAER